MVRCNLSVLMAERNLKITKVSKDTNISRTTLTALANNHSQGIQFDTLNTLCMYLGVLPNQLISFIPVDMTVDELHIGNDSFVLNMTVKDNVKMAPCVLAGNIDVVGLFSDGVLTSLAISLILECTDNDVEFVVRAFRQLPLWVVKDFEHKILNLLSEYLDQQYGQSIKISFSWDERFSY